MPHLRFHIIYSNSYEDDVIFIDELRKIASAHQNVTLTEFITRSASPDYKGNRGRLTEETLRAIVTDAPSKMYYICGPTPFNESCLKLLAQLGVRPCRMLVESNGPPQNVDRLEGWPESVPVDAEFEISVSGRSSFMAKAGEPLLNSLERNGFFVENACRSGECSLCRVKVRSGEFFQPKEAKLRKSDRKFGWVHSCVAFPTKDSEVRL